MKINILDGITVRPMRAGEEGKIAELALKTFAAQVADEFSEEGVETFVGMVSPDSLAERISDEDCFFFNACDSDTLVGTLGIRNGNQIFLFFVDTNYQRRGIGRALMNAALAEIKSRYKSAREVIVQSSRCGIKAYESLGFRVTGKEIVQEGIVSTPMRKGI